MSETSLSDAAQAAESTDQVPGDETRPVIYEMDGQVAHLIMQHRPHNLLGPALDGRTGRRHSVGAGAGGTRSRPPQRVAPLLRGR